MPILKKSKITYVEKKHKILPDGVISHTMVNYLTETVSVYESLTFCFSPQILLHYEITFQQDVQDLLRKSCLNQSSTYFTNMSCSFYFSEHSSESSIYLDFLSSFCYDAEYHAMGADWCTLYTDETMPEFWPSPQQQRNISLLWVHPWPPLWSTNKVFPVCLELFIPVIAPTDNSPCLPNPRM